jgi:methylamine---glutamate N-methyltransferase subunit A
MCGIVGLFLKNDALQPRIGALVSTMLGALSDRGPDSAGFAIYGAGVGEHIKLTLRLPDEADAAELEASFVKAGFAAAIFAERDTHLVIALPSAQEAPAKAWLGVAHPDVSVVGAGRRMELYKEVGRPETVAARFGLANMAGTHAIGHTRMATESSVTTNGAHPFSTGPDQCLVHNGSLSNHNSVRRTLKREGLAFQTDNDSEVAAGYLTWRMREGDTLKEALGSALEDLDGFYTFVVGTETGFAVLRDPIACKPAVMAETDDYVAFGSEYRALVSLPGIKMARVFEPEPATVYAWDRR